MFYLKAWQRPTLAGALAPTTIGAGELNFRVRDGNGCDLSAIVTKPTTLILLLPLACTEEFFILE
jgi:hypothetical protein